MSNSERSAVSSRADRQPAGPDESVTAVIQQQPRPDAVSHYESWLTEIVPVAQGFAGHRGVNVIRPPGGTLTYTIVLHFDTLENLTRWFESDVRARLIAKVKPFLARESIEVKAGIEFWFTPPPGQRHAKPHKQFLVTLSAIFPLTIAVPWALQPAHAIAPWLAAPLLGSFVVAAIIVGLMTYVIMPRYVRLLASWLYR